VSNPLASRDVLGSRIDALERGVNAHEWSLVLSSVAGSGSTSAT
jgi:hypothetical protein